jgi:hypothetical protein
VTPAAAVRPSHSARNTNNLSSSLLMDSSAVAVTPDVPTARTPATGGRITRSATGAAAGGRNPHAQQRATPASATRHR